MRLSQLITAATVILSSSTAFAFYFDDVCAPKTEHTPNRDTPRVGFMLDESGSMAQDSSTPGISRWDASVQAIIETVNDFTNTGAPDVAEFGLGIFGSGASWEFDAQEDAHLAGGIPDILTGWSHSGLTNIGDGARALEGENSLNTTAHPNYGIIITDGAPTDSGCSSAAAEQQMVDAVDALCSGFNRASTLTTYVIGYGTAFANDTNSMLAAAGGTGACCDATDCANVNIDVCGLTEAQLRGYLQDATSGGCGTVSLDAAAIQCTGSIDAVTNDDLKNAIQTIVETAVCTFPLDIPSMYPGGAAMPDPTATLVEMHHDTFSDPDVPLGFIGDCTAPMGTDTRDAIFAATGDPVVADGYIDEGWCWATPARTVVRLTPRLCQEIEASDIENVYTQVACPCVNVGDPCTITALTCLQPDDTMGACTNEQLMNMPCSEGIIACTAGMETCEPTGAGQLYEICNGVDDNCDGRTDNIAETYGDWPDPAIANGKHCNGMNACNCPDGAKEVVTYDGNITTALTTNWTGACTCDSALESTDQEMPVAENNADQASCTVAAKDNSPTFFLLAMVLGLMGFTRRRLRL